MLRAEKKKFEAEQRQLLKLKAKLFPGGSSGANRKYVYFLCKMGK